MLAKMNAKLIAMKLKKESVIEGIVNGTKDELHEMMSIGTTIAIAAVVFIIFLAGMKVFAPEVLNLIIGKIRGFLGDAFGHDPAPIVPAP